MAYFRRLGPNTFEPTAHVSGAWNEQEQHIAPSLGLLAHLLQEDQRSRRAEPLIPARLAYDIWGTAPMEPMETSVEVIRPGRTIELVQVGFAIAGRTIVTLRAWLLQAQDTGEVQGSRLPTVPDPAQCPAWDATSVWPGGYVASAEVRRRQEEPGRAVVWVRLGEPLLEGEDVSRFAQTAAALDIANGMTVREDPAQVAFPNVDLTAHLLREPVGEWLGFDTTVSFGARGIGVTESVLHDETGPLGTLSQSLTVRPAAS